MASGLPAIVLTGMGIRTLLFMEKLATEFYPSNSNPKISISHPSCYSEANLINIVIMPVHLCKYLSLKRRLFRSIAKITRAFGRNVCFG